MRLSPSPRIKAYRAAAGLGPTSEMGQTEKNSVRANVFRVTPESGHCSMQSACLKGANNGRDAPYSITSSAVASSEGGTVRPKAFGLQVYSQFKARGLFDRIGELRSRDEVVSVVDC
jgi:hypothetical protein